MAQECKIGKFSGVIRFKEGGYSISGNDHGGPGYLVVIPGTDEVVARVTKDGIEKVSDGTVLKPGVRYDLCTEA